MHGSQIAYWIAFGPHGPRALPPPGEGRTVFIYTMAGVAVAAVLFGATRMFAGAPPKTMTKEYQEASEEYLRVCTIFHFNLTANEHADPPNHRTKEASLSPASRACWCKASRAPRTRTRRYQVLARLVQKPLFGVDFLFRVRCAKNFGR